MLLYVMEHSAGKGLMQSPAGGVACPFPALDQLCLPNPKRLGGFYTDPMLSMCVVWPLPDRLICECAELQCARRPNHRAVFCFSTGYTCPKGRLQSCCRLQFVLLLKDRTLQINQSVQLCAFRTCRG